MHILSTNMTKLTSQCIHVHNNHAGERQQFSKRAFRNDQLITGTNMMMKLNRISENIITYII